MGRHVTSNTSSVQYLKTGMGAAHSSRDLKAIVFRHMEHSKDEEAESTSLEVDMGDMLFDEVELPLEPLASEELRASSNSKGEGEDELSDFGGKDSFEVREGCRFWDIAAISVGNSNS